MSIANTNIYKFSPRWSQTNLASKQKLSFTKTHHVDVGTFQQVNMQLPSEIREMIASSAKSICIK